MECSVYRCAKKQEMYLYLPRVENEEQALQELPEQLLVLTGQLQKVLDVDITSDRKLARVEAKEVLAAIEDKGFFLQMPPKVEVKLAE